jgi:hypothetical protein
MDYLKGLAGGLIAISSIAIFVLIIMKGIFFSEFKESGIKRDDKLYQEYKKDQKKLTLLNFISSIVLVIAITGHVLIPSTKELAVIYVLPAVARSEIVNKTMPKLGELADQWVESQLKQLREKTP